MEVIRIQLALFLRDLISRPDKFAENINQRLNNVFDAMPEILDIPMDAPPEIPIARFKSSKVPYLLNVSRMRCDLMISPQEENRFLKIIESRYHNDFLACIEEALESNAIARIGIVYSAFEEVKNPCAVISKNYFGNQIGDVDELSFRTNKIHMIDDIQVNSILKVAKGTRKSDKINGIMYTRDVNSSLLSQKDTGLTKEQVVGILNFSYAALSDEKFREVER